MGYGIRWLREVGRVLRSINVRDVFRIFVGCLKGRSLARPGRIWKDKWPLRSRDSGCELHSNGSGHVEVENTSGLSSLMNVPEICRVGEYYLHRSGGLCPVWLTV